MLKHFSLLTPAIAFTILAGVVSAQSTTSYVCPEDTPVVLTSKTQGCQCTKTSEVIPADSGFAKCSVPADADPSIQIATCQIAQGSTEGKCVQTCADTAEMRGGKCQTLNIGIPPPPVYKKRSECEATGRFPILVFQTRDPSVDGCRCVNAGSPRLTDGTHSQCPPNPTNGEYACMTYGGRGAGKCAIVCSSGYRLNVEETGCVKDTPPPVYGGGSGTGPTDPGTGTAAPECPSGSITFSRPSGLCGCAPDQDIVDEVGGTTCAAPPANGKAKCTNGSGSSSCGFECNNGYKANAAGDSCVPEVTAVDQTVSPSKCVDNPPGKFLLVASPGNGCVCRSGTDPLAANEKVCKKPATGGKITCFQNADLSVVECRATNCPTDTTPQGAECVPSKVTKRSSECTAAEYLLASPTGCTCGRVTSANRSYICFPDGSGDATCESNPDGTGATCVE